MRKRALSILPPIFMLAVAALAQKPATQYTIYSNLGHTKGVWYDTHQGWLVGQGQSIAMPFTPKADAKLTVMVVVLLHCLSQCGPDGARVTLNEDSNGLPGNVMHIWKFEKLGKSLWHSCYVTKGKSKKVIEVKKGTQYWIVAPASNVSTSLWQYTYNDIMGDFAYENNNGGWNGYNSYVSAFGVFGTKSK